MDENQIGFAWGGCGNLITHCLKSNTHYEMICAYYNKLHSGDTWTNQEWGIRGILGPAEHQTDTNINLVWENSLDTSFHYIIKNININHISGSILERVSRVIKYNNITQATLQQRNFVLLDKILLTESTLYDWCITIDPLLSEHNIKTIYNLWIEKTSMFYQQYSDKVLGYFSDLSIDYRPTTLYNILYENPNIRQQQF